MNLPWKAKEFTGEWSVYPECYFEDLAGRDAGDPWVWSGPVFRYVGDTAVPVEPKKYRPQDHRELPFEIAKLRHADAKQISRFVRTWGLLGRHEIESAKRRGSVPDHYYGMPLDEGKEKKVESIEWIRRQGRTMHLVISLIQALYPSNVLVVAQAVRDFIDAEDESPGGTARFMWENIFRSMFFRDSDAVERDPINRALAEVPEKVAQELTAFGVSTGIEGIRPYLSLNDAPTLRFEFNAMIEVAFLHVAQLSMEGASVTRCAECGEYFQKRDGRQRFCPPPLGAKESPCGYKQRYRRFKKGE